MATARLDGSHEPMRARGLPLALLLGLAVAACGGDPPEPVAGDPSAAARAALTTRIDALPPGPERLELEIERAVAGLQGTRGAADWKARLAAAVENLAALRNAQQATGDTAAEARVRVALGKHLSMLGAHDQATAELDWVLANAPDSPAAPAALHEKAGDLYRQKDYTGCKALLEQLIERYPESPEAARAPAGIENCDRRLSD